MSVTKFVADLKDAERKIIIIRLYEAIKELGVIGQEKEELIDDALSSRVCDLEDLIEINDLQVV